MNWEEFAQKLIPLLQGVLHLFDHVTPEGRALLHRSRATMRGQLEAMLADLEKAHPKEPKVEHKADHKDDAKAHPSAKKD